MCGGAHVYWVVPTAGVVVASISHIVIVSPWLFKNYCVRLLRHVMASDDGVKWHLGVGLAYTLKGPIDQGCIAK